MPRPRIIRWEPTARATGVIGVIWATGIPARSNSAVIAAPLRVLVPQVDVRITESTADCFSLWAISLPIRRLLSRGLVFPVVERNSGCNLPMCPSRSNSRTTSTGTSRFGSCCTY